MMMLGVMWMMTAAVVGFMLGRVSMYGQTGVLEAVEDMEELTLEELREASELFEEDVYDALNLENCMALRSSYGGPAVNETTRQIEEIEAFIAAREEKEA